MTTRDIGKDGELGKLCDLCRQLATRGVFDYEEIQGIPGLHRQFQQRGAEKLGCRLHPPDSRTYYLDGRIIKTSETKSELVPY